MVPSISSGNLLHHGNIPDHTQPLMQNPVYIYFRSDTIQYQTITAQSVNFGGKNSLLVRIRISFLTFQHSFFLGIHSIDSAVGSSSCQNHSNFEEMEAQKKRNDRRKIRDEVCGHYELSCTSTHASAKRKTKPKELNQRWSR